MVNIAEAKKTKKKDLKQMIEIPMVASLMYKPNVEAIQRIKQAYKGKYIPIDPLTNTRKGESKEGIGAIVFLATEVPVQKIVSHPTLDQEAMDGAAYDILSEWWKADPQVFRPAFRNLLSSFVRELWHSGFVVGERYFPSLKWQAVKDFYLQGRPPPEPCETVVIRPSENMLIVRDETTGFVSQAPYFMRYEAAKEGNPTTEYIGPFHMNQIISGAVHTTGMTDFYGLSPFMPLMTEITSVGKGFRVISTIARDVVKPRFAISLIADAGEEDMRAAKQAATEYIDAMDSGEYDEVLVIPNSTRVDWLYPKMNLSDAYKFIRGMHQLILMYMGIPETLLFSEANRGNTEVQERQFEQRMKWYRDVIWEWWERHFRLILLENGIPDYETTPIIVKWGVEGEETEEEQENLPSPKPKITPPIEQMFPPTLPPAATEPPPIDINEVI